MTESRTQIDFKDSARIDFATYVYPKIRNKQGVVTAGVDSILINEKPQFSVYLDCDNKIVTAVLTAKYGSIEIRMPDKTYDGSKIVIRDIQKEEQLIACFERFSYCIILSFVINADTPPTINGIANAINNAFKFFTLIHNFLSVCSSFNLLYLHY